MTSSTLITVNFRYEITPDNVRQMFENIGTVYALYILNTAILFVNIIQIRKSVSDWMFDEFFHTLIFVEMADNELAQKAINSFNNQMFDIDVTDVELLNDSNINNVNYLHKFYPKYYDSISNSSTPKFIKHISNFVKKTGHQLHQQQSIQSILRSFLFSNKGKEIKLKQYYDELKSYNKVVIYRIFNKETINDINNNLNSCQTEIEKILLDIIEFIVEKGIISCIFNGFFDIIKQSGLLKKIEKLIEDRFCQEEKGNKQFSDQIVQFVRIYLSVTNLEEQDEKLIDKSAQVLNYKFTQFLNFLTNQKNQAMTEQLQIELEQTSHLIQIVKNNRNKHYLFFHYKLEYLDEHVKERIASLFHINCSSELNCPQNIIIQSSSQLQELQTLILDTIGKFIYCNRNFEQILVVNHNIIQHLMSIINIFDQQKQQCKTKIIVQQQHIFPSPAILSSTLKLLQQFVLLNKYNCQIASSDPKFNQSLINLYKYQIDQQNNQNHNQLQSNIQNLSLQCMYSIWNYSDVEVLQQYIQLGYISIISLGIALGGGYSQSNNQFIQNVLYHILDMYYDLKNGRQFSENLPDRPFFPSQQLLVRISDEQLEEEGEIEEIEALLINKYYKFIKSIRDSANETKRILQNSFVHTTNINLN